MLRLPYKSRCVGELRTAPSNPEDFEYANSISETKQEILGKPSFIYCERYLIHLHERLGAKLRVNQTAMQLL